MNKKFAAFTAVFGFLTVFGAVGGMEQTTELFRPLCFAVVGLALMFVGVNGIKNG